MVAWGIMSYGSVGIIVRARQQLKLLFRSPPPPPLLILRVILRQRRGWFLRMDNVSVRKAGGYGDTLLALTCDGSSPQSDDDGTICCQEPERRFQVAY
ncbi:hypothetical protein F2P81_001516 [Scophthalmus maximus]|uniref:Uncharacterized protein n=1 Tax=Scophthalmus maximus TaxID=52904 RepID=A0A6A4TEF8_SCOMX|nr:hypothetical protein F2P81_001516 [Scophthalmus maximus]